MSNEIIDVYCEGRCEHCKERVLIYLKNYDNLDEVRCPLCDKGIIKFIKINGMEDI